MNTYDDFQQIGKVEDTTINKYKELLPKELIEAWRIHGYGTFMNGYLKVVNPDEFVELVNETYIRNKGTIPIFATSM
ncbi:GAD-like domain-containing protein [Bacillus sp. REN3]|uniref:GAD-like domain-containing protein n=1 Tax=Bacillus sp. REN3 TaxID=2802440 RepID=UPI001FEFE148|nr:GAD-like domain-containing protein [Bacillus sp. REN3]